MISKNHKHKKAVEPLEVLEKVGNKVVSSTLGSVSFKDFFTDLKKKDANKEAEETEKKKKEMEEKNKNKAPRS